MQTKDPSSYPLSHLQHGIPEEVLANYDAATPLAITGRILLSNGESGALLLWDIAANQPLFCSTLHVSASPEFYISECEAWLICYVEEDSGNSHSLSAYITYIGCEQFSEAAPSFYQIWGPVNNDVEIGPDKNNVLWISGRLRCSETPASRNTTSYPGMANFTLKN